MTRGLDNCLFMYPRSEWEILEARLKELPLTKKEARRFCPVFVFRCRECDVDKQGRITIPPNLREHARLEKEVVAIGASNRSS